MVIIFLEFILLVDGVCALPLTVVPLVIADRTSIKKLKIFALI